MVSRHADAVAQNIDIIDSYDVEYVLILAGDHIYKMDYERMIRHHVTSGADVTVGCLTVPRMEATAFGVMDVDANDVITSFLEKPADPPGTPAIRPSRWPRWASTSSRGRSCATCCCGTWPIRTPAMISAPT
jgi:ADP-glucose pyrophosphorylase